MKRIIAILLCLCLLPTLLCACAGDTGAEKQFTFLVTHGDGTEKTFTITTEKSTLAEALKEEGLIRESASAGLYDVVDGEKADWNDGEAWWCISQEGVPLTVGMDQVALQDGDAFEAVFTRGNGD